MRYKIKYPKDGETRVVTKFLWFPQTIGFEERWLERASWKEVFSKCPLGLTFLDVWIKTEWKD